MRRVIGVDPGSRKTGYGIIEISLSKISYVTSGHISVDDEVFPKRLGIIYSEVLELARNYDVQEMAMQQPVCFDEETADLMQLLQEERLRRAA